MIRYDKFLEEEIEKAKVENNGKKAFVLQLELNKWLGVAL